MVGRPPKKDKRVPKHVVVSQKTAQRLNQIEEETGVNWGRQIDKLIK